MDNEQLKTFTLVKKVLNLSRAAEMLHVTQPTVTQRIQSLEKELDCKLFDKEGKKIFITEEGEVFARYSEKILDYIQEAKESIDLVKEPRLNVGFAPFSSEFVMQGINSIKSNRKLSLSISEGLGSKELTDKVINREIDLAIVRTHYSHPDLLSRQICDDKLLFIVGKYHPLASKDNITKDDLIGETLICFLRDTPVWNKIEEKIAGIENLKRFEVRTLEKLKQMVIANWGVSFVPLLSLETYEKNQLCVKPFEGFNEITDDKVIALYRNDSPNNKFIQSFIESMKNEIELSVI